jgi:hypothetical protein
MAVRKGKFFQRGSFSVLFGFIKKSNQTEIFLKKNRNRVKPTGFGLVWFFGQNPVQTDLALFSRFWLGFFGLARFLSVSARLGSVFLVFCL